MRSVDETWKAFFDDLFHVHLAKECTVDGRKPEALASSALAKAGFAYSGPYLWVISIGNKTGYASFIFARKFVRTYGIC